MSYASPSYSGPTTIKLILKAPLPPDLFSRQAEQAAKLCCGRDVNKSSQIRRFYDELVLWHDQVRSSGDAGAKFEEVRPYVQMLRAKVAYANARGLVDAQFKTIFDELINGIDSPESLENAKLFFEALLGFKKYFEECGSKRH